MKREEVLEFLSRSVDLLKGLDRDLLAQLVAGSALASMEPNEALVRIGEEGRFLGILLDGEAVVSVTDDTGEAHELAVLKKGDVLGEMALLSNEKSTADVVARSRCTVLQVPRTLFPTLLASHPQALAYLSRLVISRLKTPAYDEKAGQRAVQALRASDDPYGFKLKSERPMKILVVNCGSSSLKYNLYDTGDDHRNASGLVEKIGEDGTRHIHKYGGEQQEQKLPGGTHKEAFLSMVELLTAGGRGALHCAGDVAAVGHRVVHGGSRYGHAEVINETVIKDITELCSLAPLHNPVNLTGIQEAMALFPKAVNVAVFDTAFHQTMPPYAHLYGLPYQYAERGIRRYGFHGMSHKYVSLKAAEHLKRPFSQLRLIVCHLGNGASVCAVDHGRSVDTSMGLTPAEGLLMGTRCGDLDPGALLHLARTEHLDPDQLDRLINRESGLKGLSGLSNDMRTVQQAASDGNPRALLAYKTFCYRIRKYIGAYFAAMGGLDALVFTGGIGQGARGVRGLACQGLSCMGIALDDERNAAALSPPDVREISADGAPVKVLVIPTDEERMIARETLRAISRGTVTTHLRSQQWTPVPLEVSAHHLHLSRQHVEALFGPGHTLTPVHELSQPGQFACKEQVDIVGPRGRVDRVRVLGPERPATQVEISMTEQFKLGIHPPIRQSGDIAGSPGCTLTGPEGSVVLSEGVICALRHIHMSPEEALKMGLRDKDVVSVRVTGGRGLTFSDVLVRVHPSFRLAMHIDTDEANAAGVGPDATGYVESVEGAH